MLSINILFIVLFLFSLENGDADELHKSLHHLEVALKNSKSLKDKKRLLTESEQKLERMELDLFKKPPAGRAEAVGYNIALGPIFDADFEKNKAACDNDGVKAELLSLYHGRSQKMPPHAEYALKILALVCNKPQLSKPEFQ